MDTAPERLEKKGDLFAKLIDQKVQRENSVQLKKLMGD
jgi:hypothetical protein